MLSNNYFKVGKSTIFPFSDQFPADISRAYTAALLYGDRVAVWKMPAYLGPWRFVGIVGHRDEASIKADMIGAAPDDIRLLTWELEARRTAGRAA